MNNNNISNINTLNTQQSQTELIVKPTGGQLPITATNGVLITENNLPGVRFGRAILRKTRVTRM